MNGVSNHCILPSLYCSIVMVSWSFICFFVKVEFSFCVRILLKVQCRLFDRKKFAGNFSRGEYFKSACNATFSIPVEF